MHLQNLKLLRPTVEEKMHLKEKTFDLDLGVNVTRNIAQYPLHHVVYASTQFIVATSYGLGEDTITRDMTVGQTDRRTDGQRTDFGTKLIHVYPNFSNR